jgi:hypothetical protein
MTDIQTHEKNIKKQTNIIIRVCIKKRKEDRPSLINVDIFQSSYK